MTDARTILDPTSERRPAARGRLARPASLDGVTVGLLDISSRGATCCSTASRNG